jgi:hypothetical protein
MEYIITEKSNTALHVRRRMIVTEVSFKKYIQYIGGEYDGIVVMNNGCNYVK